MKLGSSLRRRRGSRNRDRTPGRFASLFASLGTAVGRLGFSWSFLKDPWTLGVLAFLVLLGFGGGYLISTRVLYPVPPPPGDLFEVPNLAGLSPEEALDTLDAMGLVLGRVDSLNHPTAPEGAILGQSPLPGQLSLAGDTMRVAMSTGPERKPVPDVLGLGGDWAQTILETAGFLVVVDSLESQEVRGSVVSMNPEAGTEATIPMEVRLSLSLGPPEFEMPLLLGRPEEEARSVLDSLDLNLVEVETRFRFGRDQGLVVEQEPPAGTRVEAGAEVRLVVGRRGESQ